MDWLLGAKKHQHTWADSAPAAGAGASAGPSPGPSGPSTMLAQAQSIPLATDGLSDPNVPASVPKWNQILPQSNIAQLGTGKEQKVDFNIQCQDIGKIQNLLLQFDYTTGGATPVLIPTPYWINRVDFIAPDGSTLETVYNDSLFTETCALLTDQTVNTVAPLFNFQVTQTSTGSARLDVSGALATGPITVSNNSSSNTTVEFAPRVTVATSYTHWLSLNASFLVACQPYLRGCSSSGYVKISMYLNPCLSSDDSQVTQGTIVLNQLQLWVQEAVLSQTAEKALMMAHKSGIQYSSVVRNQMVFTIPGGLSANGQDKINLTGYYSESAGLYLMFKRSSSNSSCLERLSVKSMYLQDSQGRQLTQEMSSRLIESIVSPQVISVSSYFINSDTQTTYIFPFCTNIQRVIEGKMLGSYQLTGNERLVVTANASGLPSSTQLVATSWDYAKIVVANNQMKQYVLGSNA